MRPTLPVLLLTALSAHAARGPSPASTDRPVGLEPAPPDAARLRFPADADRWVADFEAWSADHATRRLHATVERPLIRPGEALSATIWSVATRGMAPGPDLVTVTLEDPRGVTMASHHLPLPTGVGTVQLPLSAAAPGGTYTLKIRAQSGALTERTVVVADPETPRIDKVLTFPRASYRPGDRVRAELTLSRATGEPLADTVAVATLQVDGQEHAPFDVRTDGHGRATVAFTLPDTVRTPDAVLLVRVDDGGSAEAISRPVPVVLHDVHLGWFPEGGDLVEGLPSRVYFEATGADGEAVEVAGAVVDDRGERVARFASWVDGRGHVSFTPQPGRRYAAAVSGQDELVPLPTPLTEGCTLRHRDDLDGEQRAVRVTVACTDTREVVVAAMQQEQLLDRAALRVVAGRPVTVHLRSGDPALDGAEGVARVTVFGGAMAPLAERLVSRNRGRRLSVTLTPDRAQYAPGDPVSLEVRTADPDGRPVPASVAVAVVDDAVLTLADDRQHDIVSQLLLNAALPEPIDGAPHLFHPERDGLGVDLVLGTRGWTRFDWSAVAGYTTRPRTVRVWAKAVDTASTSTGQVLTREFLQRIPVGRTYQSAVQTVPGVAPTREHAPPPPRPARVDGVRADLRDAVLWAPQVRTDAAGRAQLTFTLADTITELRATAEGLGAGAVGAATARFASVLPLSVDARIPEAVSAGDRLLLPITVTNRGEDAATVDLALRATGPIAVEGDPADVVVPAGGKRTVHVPIVAQPGEGTATLSVSAAGGAHHDALQRELTVAPRGFPGGFEASGTLGDREVHTFLVPPVEPGSVRAGVTLLPSIQATLTEGLEAMIRTPGGCFEQTSSTNYPNVLAFDLLDRVGRGDRAPADRERILDAGYQRLTGYQVASGGYETFGAGPGKEALTAYGLLQFTDMARVYPVSAAMLDQTARYLLGQRTGTGGYRVTGASAHGYGTAPPEVLDAYITYALVETGHTALDAEIAATAALARQTRDPYRLALAALTLLAVRPDEGRAAVARLASLQAADGSFPGSETSITRSENQNLLVEATALATIALVRAGDLPRAGAAVDWLHRSQRRAGSWGATQGNALALKALAAYGETEDTGKRRIAVAVDGRQVADATFEGGQPEPVTLQLGALASGSREIAVTLDGAPVPYALDVAWTTRTPAPSPDRRVDLETTLSDTTLRVGESARLTVRLADRTDRVVPEPIVRVGLPAGLVPQAWQLEQLKERGLVAFVETRPREVTLYWHGIAPGEVHEVVLDLVAEVPGAFEGPASSAFPYYDDQAKAWVAGIAVEIAP